MSETRAENAKALTEASEVPQTPAKGTPSKRKSRVNRDREESEELIKSMGGAVQEGGRRTRSSSARAVVVPATPPPPAKKSKLETPSRRGRPKKDIVDVEEPDTTDAPTPVPATPIDEVATEAEVNAAVDPEPDTESMEVDGAICSKSTEKDDEDEPAADAEVVLENGDSAKADAVPADAVVAAPAEAVADESSSTDKVAAEPEVPVPEPTQSEPSANDEDETAVPESETTTPPPTAAPVEVSDDESTIIEVPEANAADEPQVAPLEPDAISVDSSNASSVEELTKSEVKVPEVAINDEPTIESSVPVAEDAVL